MMFFTALTGPPALNTHLRVSKTFTVKDCIANSQKVVSPSAADSSFILNKLPNLDFNSAKNAKKKYQRIK